MGGYTSIAVVLDCGFCFTSWANSVAKKNPWMKISFFRNNFPGTGIAGITTGFLHSATPGTNENGTQYGRYLICHRIIYILFHQGSPLQFALIENNICAKTE